MSKSKKVICVLQCGIHIYYFVMDPDRNPDPGRNNLVKDPDPGLKRKRMERSFIKNG